MGLWDAVSDVSKGVGRFARMPGLAAWRLGQTGYKSVNFFVDVAQEAVYEHGLPLPFKGDIGKGKEIGRFKAANGAIILAEDNNEVINT